VKLNLFRSRSKVAPHNDEILRLSIDESRLSAANVESLREHYFPQVVGQSILVLRLNQLTFIDSSGLGFLVGLRKNMLPPQKVVLEGISDPTLLDLFKLTRMDQIFLLCSDSKEAELLLSR